MDCACSKVETHSARHDHGQVFTPGDFQRMQRCVLRVCFYLRVLTKCEVMEEGQTENVRGGKGATANPSKANRYE